MNFLKKKFYFQNEFIVFQEFDFFMGVVIIMSHHIFLKNLSKIYSLTIFGHTITFNIFYHTLAVCQNLHKREYFTLKNVVYLVSNFYDVTSRIFKKH